METTRSATLLRIAREALAKRTNKADEGADSGFTLIEPMVVLLILAILLAIAIPTFLGVTNSAHDRAAQSNLTNALTSAKASFVNAQQYSANGNAEIGALNTDEPSLNFITTASKQQGDISVGVYPHNVGAGTNTVLVLATYSPSTNTCWWAADVENGTAASGVGAAAIAVGHAGHGGIAYASQTNVTDNGASCSAAAATVDPLGITGNQY